MDNHCGGGYIGVELNKVSSIEVLGQLMLGIDFENLRMKKKGLRKRKKERGIKQIEKASI